MSSVQRFRPKRLLVILGASLGACVLLFGLGMMLARLIDPVSRSTDCARVAGAFTDALMTGDAGLARTLAVSDAGIAEWMSARRGFSCPFSLDIEASVGSMVCGSGNNAPTEYSCGFSYFCGLGGSYLFRLETIDLEQKAEGCRVTSWSPPCEAFGDEVGEKCRRN